MSSKSVLNDKICSKSMNKAFCYSIIERKYIYELIWRDRKENLWPEDMLIRLSQGEERPVSGPWAFNWAVRRDPCFLVSGDLPRFALLRTFRVPELNPPFAKLGDLRICCHTGDSTFWLDEANILSARFFAWGTVHRVTLQPLFPLDFIITAVLVDNCGIAIEVEINSDSRDMEKIELELIYGGVTWKNSSLTPSYFDDVIWDSIDNEVVLQDNKGIILKGDLPINVMVESEHEGIVTTGAITHEQKNGKYLVFKKQLPKGVIRDRFRLIAFQFEDGQEEIPVINRFEEYVRKTKHYFECILDEQEINTPDEVLDAGFYAAVMNLEYSYQSPAWLEGVHKWNSYIVNNYQISAAVCLGQLERAKAALMFFGERPGGPCQPLHSDGTPFTRSSLSSNLQHDFEDGLCYFILQLYRYWTATEDNETIKLLFEAAARNLEHMIEIRDPDGNLLLNWHFGCNMFLYQADHLSLPGDAFSPTIMVTDCLEKMAEIAEALGHKDKTEKWRNMAEYMRNEVVRRLWSEERGRFLSAIDPQGIVMEASYYTDFVFPQLYSRLQEKYKWESLQALDHTLWVDDDLMRVGNFKPPLFGNDNIMPLQMAEAAEAYFKAGRSDKGWKLLHGVARSATTHTESPGSFPERMSDSGFGQPDYLFANPAGAYVQAVIAGLFGFSRTGEGKVLYWSPSVPKDWNKASLRLGNTSFSITGRHGDRKYSISLEQPQELIIMIPLVGHRLLKLVDLNDKCIPYKVISHPSGDFVLIHSEPQKKYEFRVVSEYPDTNVNTSESLHIDNNPKLKRLIHSGVREHMALDDFFNGDSIKGRNFWCFTSKILKLDKYIGGGESGGIIKFDDYSFNAFNRKMIILEVGVHDVYTQKLLSSEKPSRIEVRVGKVISGLEVLCVCEANVRLTGVKIGWIRLFYNDGTEHDEALIYGKNIDCMTKPFATEAASFELDWLNYLSAFRVAADKSKILASFEIRVYAADASLGILAINTIV